MAHKLVVTVDWPGSRGERRVDVERTKAVVTDDFSAAPPPPSPTIGTRPPRRRKTEKRTGDRGSPITVQDLMTAKALRRRFADLTRDESEARAWCYDSLWSSLADLLNVSENAKTATVKLEKGDTDEDE